MKLNLDKIILLTLFAMASIGCDGSTPPEPIFYTHIYEIENKTNFDVNIAHEMPSWNMISPIILRANGCISWDIYADNKNWQAFYSHNMDNLGDMVFSYADGTEIRESELPNSRKIFNANNWESQIYGQEILFSYTITEEDYLFAKSLEGENQTK